jgi:hypothetical protein
MQTIQNETNNYASQQVEVSQENNIIIGGEEPINPCASDIPVQTCIEKSRCNTPGNYIPPIYQCNLIRDGSGATSVSACDAAFGQATQEEYCYGTPETCRKQLLRKTCGANPPGSFIPLDSVSVSCQSSADCPVGTTCDLNRKLCGVETTPGYTEDNTCGGNCGTKTVYQIEFIASDGKRTFTLDNRESVPTNVGLCSGIIPLSKPGEACYRAYNLDDYYDCVQVVNTGIKIPENCIDNCKKLACSAEKIKLLTPAPPFLNVEGKICLQNTAKSTFNSTQFAEATTRATLTSQISSQFQNDITKTISQTNKGINFNQENNSQERTSITQKVRNTISQALSASSKNNVIQSDKTKQINNFILNRGTVTVTSGGCKSAGDPLNDQCVNVKTSPGCGLLLTNESISELNSTQTARSVVDALLDSNILNDLKNEYDFTATQTNENDLLGGLFNLLMGYVVLIAVFGLIAIGMVYVLGKTALEVVKTPWFWVAFVILVLAGLGIWLGVDQPWVKTTTITISNPSGQPPSPLPSDPSSQPGKNEIKCEIGNTAGCNCSIFVTKGEADKLTEVQKKEICSTIIGDLQTNPTSTIDAQCSEIKDVQWGGTKFTSEFCGDTIGKYCSLRNYTSLEGIRAYCTSPDGSTLPAPTTAAPTKAPTSTSAPTLAPTSTSIARKN